LRVFNSAIRNPQSAIVSMVPLLSVGFLSILVQTILLRELSVAYYGVELIYTLAIAFWLLWTAAGALISRSKLNPARFQLAALFVLSAILLPLDLSFIRAVRLIFAPAPGAYLPFVTQVLSMAASLLPVGILVGLQFQWAAKTYVAGGKSLALAYAIESAGGLGGGLCATLFAMAGIGSLTTVLISSLMATLTAYALVRTPETRTLRYALLAVAALFAAACWWAPRLDRRMTAWNHPYLVDTRDSPYGRVSVTRYAGQVSVFENDALTFDSEGTEAEEFVQLTALQHPNPAHVLILGGGIEGTVRETLSHSPRQLDYVELNPVLLAAAQAQLPPELQSSFTAPGVRVLISDPRDFLKRAGQYDLILVGMPEPASGQANRFYTGEFYQECASRLNPGGVIGFRLRSSENLWTPQLRRRNASIYAALKTAFADIEVLPGSTNTFIASLAPLSRDPALLAERFKQRRINARLVSPAYIRYLYENDRFRQVAAALKSESAPPNMDFRPACYQYTAVLWLSKFMPRLGFIDLDAIVSPERGIRWPWLMPVFAVPIVFGLARRRASLHRAFLSGTAGFLGMLVETLLMLQYQVKSGVLFQNIGILLMSFMAGLALGGLAADRIAWRRQGISWSWGAGLLAAFIALGTYAGRATGLWTTSGLLLLAGVLVAGIFSYAAFRGLPDQRLAVSPLYSADLIGGCLGSLAATLVLIPFAGIKATGIVITVLAVMSGLLL